MIKIINNTFNTATLLLLALVPAHLQADFLDKVGDKVFQDPKKDTGLLEALLNSMQWISAVFGFLGVILLFVAAYELRKKDVGSFGYTLAAVAVLFMSPLIVKTLRSWANF